MATADRARAKSATPAPATVSLFGAPFDRYTEAEAIAEGYIVDVAASIISYKTLYNLHCHFVPPSGEEEKIYPKGVVSRALMNVAFQDNGLMKQIRQTEVIKAAGEIVGIELLDHIVFNRTGYFSFLEAGRL